MILYSFIKLMDWFFIFVHSMDTFDDLVEARYLL
jgi:hypothetical protein